MLLIVMVLVAVLDVLVLLGMGQEGDVWLVIGFVVLFIVAFATLVVERVQRRRDVDRRSQIDCSFRLVYGVQDGITAKWVVGATVISPGRGQFPADGRRYPFSDQAMSVDTGHQRGLGVVASSLVEGGDERRRRMSWSSKSRPRSLNGLCPQGPGRSGWAIEAVMSQDEPT